MGIFSGKDQDRHVGTVSEPQGDGPVTLSDRTDARRRGQPRHQPGQDRADEPDARTTRSRSLRRRLEDMSAGAAAAQLPSHPAAAPAVAARLVRRRRRRRRSRWASAGRASCRPHDRPEVDIETSTGRAHGPTGPVQQTSGEAHRVGGLNGVAPAGESIETDVEGGATRMGAAPPDAVPGLSSGHGETGGAPAPGDAASLGTSETQPKVEGVRLPEADQPA